MPEQLVPTRDIWGDAFFALGSPSLIQSSIKKDIIISKFPKKEIIDPASGHQWASFEGLYVTGLRGESTITGRGFVSLDGQFIQVDIKPGSPWEFRWDYDPVKGSHINVSVGGKKSVSFAMMYPDGHQKRQPQSASSMYLDVIVHQTPLVEYYAGMNAQRRAEAAEALSAWYVGLFEDEQKRRSVQ